MRAFDEFVSRSDEAMVVVTVGDGPALDGCLVGFHTQVSIEPRRYLVCLSHANATFRRAASATALAVHLLATEDKDLASLFGEHTADDDVDKFGRCTWHRTGAGPPVLDRALAWFVGTIVERVPMGDHTGHVLAPSAAGGGLPGVPLRFSDVERFAAGHEADGGQSSQ